MDVYIKSMRIACKDLQAVKASELKAEVRTKAIKQLQIIDEQLWNVLVLVKDYKPLIG